MNKLLLLGLSLCASFSAFAQNSVLTQGDWYKFSVSTDGVYRIDYNTLKKAGIDPASINPKNISLYMGQPGMLPQANSASRISDPVEMAITVVGEGDGKFDGSDYILFYAQGPDSYSWDTQRQIFSYQKNIYSDKNFYFLTVGSTAGKRISQRSSSAGSFPAITQFDDIARYENDQYNILHSGRQWFGEQFDQGLQITIRFDMPGIVPNSSIKLTSHVMAQSIKDCSFAVSFNGQSVLSQPIPAIINSAYATKGNEVADTISISESSVHASSQTAQDIQYVFTKGGSGLSIGYLDFVMFQTERTLALYGSQTIFQSSASTSNAISSFQVSAATSTSLVWDVTQQQKVVQQAGNLTSNNFSFAVTTDTLRKFCVFEPLKVSTPTFESKLSNQNLHALSAADMLIITAPAWIDQANRLAAFRQSHDGLTVKVVSTDAVFLEYAGGKGDVSAIRDFIRDRYTQWNGSLRYVLLFGRGSFDFKNRTIGNTNYVPIYESYNSLDPLGTYSSDDYFGFLEANEGSWPESPAVNYSLDIGIGRLPVKSSAEAKQVVDKLIGYSTNTKNLGAWCSDFLLVADDGDFNIHENQMDQLANTIETQQPDFRANKLFLASYKQTMGANGQTSAPARKALDLTIRKGKAIVNYTGHGSENVWTQELILDRDLVESLENGPRYPLFVTATCEFGRNDDPGIISSAELLLLQPNGGGIGLVTTARPVNSSTNFQLNQAFYQALFAKQNGQFRRLGSVVRDTKNNSLSGVANRNFSLLGDPSLKLVLPDDQVVVQNLKTATGSDTLKALSVVSLDGQVQHNNVLASSFEGTATIRVFDKLQNSTTLGDPEENVNPPAPAYAFTQRPTPLFEGRATVTAGQFHSDWIIPDDLLSGFGNGRLNVIAFSTQSGSAVGSKTITVGGMEKSPTGDTKSPVIQLYMSDSTFVSGGTVSANTQLYARLSDESGINTSSTGGHDLTATLDGRWTYTLNEYYQADKNNFTRGTVTYPLDTLKPGAHTLTLTAFDTYNNSSTASVEFNVAGGSGIQINDLVAYPNPLHPDKDVGGFSFTHSRAGEDLLISIYVHDMFGHVVTQLDYAILSSTYEVNLEGWSGKSFDGTKFGSGLYVVRISVRSQADGSESGRSTKLIVVN